MFDEQRESDEAGHGGPHDVDLSSHLDVFYTVYNRVQDTPQVVLTSGLTVPEIYLNSFTL